MANHKNTKAHLWLCGAAATAMMVGAFSASAADIKKPAGFPTRPLTMIVPYGAGGGSDQLARAMASAMDKVADIQFQVVNKPGGGGTAAIPDFMPAPADGYTVMEHIDNAVSAFAKGDIRENPAKDWVPICTTQITFSQIYVRSAYVSGTPAIGVGMGNVVTIIDETANLDEAATKIVQSKIFDNATSCSSENAVITMASRYEETIEALQKAGGYLLSAGEVAHLEQTYFGGGKMHRGIMAQDMDKMLSVLGFDHIPASTKFLIAPTDKIGKAHKISGEKMALFLALYKASSFDEAVTLGIAIQKGQGAGHSIGLHSQDDSRAHKMAMAVPTCRVIVNQAHCFATGGSFDNGLPFSLSMGCGSWGGNSIDENFNWRHLVNKTVIARPIAPQEPTIDEIFASYFKAIS